VAYIGPRLYATCSVALRLQSIELVSSTLNDCNRRSLMEGSQARLPAPSPRGNVRDSFPSHGSSSTKASENASLTRKLGMRPEQPSRYTLAAVIHVLQQCWRRTRPWCCAHLLSPHTNSSPNFLATHHLSDVGPLSCQVKQPLYPRHYSVAFAFSDILLPHRHRQTLQPAVPEGSDTAFPRSACRSKSG
jgi:hypothetical protein